MISQTYTSRSLGLPREIRDQIIGEVIFPSEKELRPRVQTKYSVAMSTRRQIFPSETVGRQTQRKYDVAIIRACRQLQSEAEAILYGTSSFNLMYGWKTGSFRFAYSFLQDRPKRLRRLIQRVECRCYDGSHEMHSQLFEWGVLCKLLATQCPSLHSLRLRGPENRYACLGWLKYSRQAEGWVQTLFQIRTLRHFDIQILPETYCYGLEAYRLRFLAWLRDAMVNGPKPAVHHQAQSQLFIIRLKASSRPHFHF